MGRERARKAIYTFAGIYLIYLAYTMGRDWNQIPDKERIFVGIALAAFVVIGAGLAIWGAKGVLRQPGQDLETDEQEEIRDGADVFGAEPALEETGSEEKTKEEEE